MRKPCFLALFLLCAACAKPQVQPYQAQIVEPALMQAVFIAADKAELPVRSWLPHAKPKAVLIAIHGFNDYSHGLQMPGAFLSAHGIAVLAYDQRGFGRAMNRGIWAGEDNVARDAANMVRAVRRRYPNIPLYLMGESMGGAVVIEAAIRPDFPPVDGIILSAPAVWGGETMNPLLRASLWSLAHIWPGKILTGEHAQIYASDNIAMLRELLQDPLVIKETRADAIYGLVQLMDDAYRDIGKIKVPVLLLYGAHDEVIPPEPVSKAARKLSGNLTFACYPQGYHMLLRDRDRYAPTQDITAWIEDNTHPLPSGFDEEAAAKPGELSSRCVRQ